MRKQLKVLLFLCALTPWLLAGDSPLDDRGDRPSAPSVPGAAADPGNGAGAAAEPEAAPGKGAEPLPPAKPGQSIKDYKVNPYDILEISVYREPDLHKIVRVSNDGFISFPLIGKVAVAGQDVLSVEKKIAGLLGREYLVNPSVTIFVKEYNAKKVYVMGEVKNPGPYVITEDKGLSALESVALAGGFNPAAAANNTKIIRMENGKKKYIEVKLGDITKKGDKSRDVRLLPNDIVLVPARLF
ncbi:MAG: polysaccharide biosynthesis/export family protein [Endomicrobiales bacterium]